MPEPITSAEVRKQDRPPRALAPVDPARGLKRFRARWLGLLAATIIALYLCWLMLQPLVGVALWAMVLTIVFYPIRNWFMRRIHHPSAAAALTCAFVVAAILLPIALVTTAVVNEARLAAVYLQGHAAYLLSRDNRVFQFLSRYIVDLDRLGTRDYLVLQIQNLSGDVAGKLPGLVGGALVRVLELIFVLLTMYYLFRDGDRVQAALLDSLPLERAQSQRIFDRTREVIGASVYGVLVIATLQAILGGLSFWILGLPSPLLWAVVMFFLSMIPMAGSFIVWVPAAGYLALSGHWVHAVILAAWCAGVVGMIDNLLRPRLVGKRTRLHELLIFFSVLGGLELFGMVGLVMGPVTVAITLALVDVFRKADRFVGSDEPTLIEKQAALRNVPRDAGPAPAESPGFTVVIAPPAAGGDPDDIDTGRLAPAPLIVSGPRLDEGPTVPPAIAPSVGPITLPGSR